MQRFPSLAVLAGTALLLSAALYNRYPLTFWDTRIYVEHAGTLLPRPDRLIGYSVLMRVLSWKLTLWPVVVAQCLLVAALVRYTLRCLRGRTSDVRYLLLMGFLTACSALPWIAGQLMADVFTPVLVIALWLLVFDPALGPWHRGALLALTALCVTVHLTHLPLGLGLLGVAWLLLAGPRQPRAWQRVRTPALALLVGLAAISSFNYARSGRASLASGSDTFVFGHLVDSGIASRLLDEHCPARGYLLCPHRRSLPMSVDELLWVDKLGLHPWEHARAIATDTHRMLWDSLREHPGLHLAVALDYTWRVLTRFRTGEGLDGDARPVIEAQIARYAPADLVAFRAARQQSDELPIQQVRSLHTPVGWFLLALASLLLLGAVSGGVSLAQRSVSFVTFTCCALLLNALISGNLSGIYDRYESRLVWLLALGLAGDLPLSDLATSAPLRQLQHGLQRGRRVFVAIGERLSRVGHDRAQ
jgi:hypothetical protein